MARIITLSVGALILCANAFLPTQGVAADPAAPVGWQKDLATAQQHARRLNRPILLHFYGPRCPPCRMMEATVLNTPEVIDLLSNRYVGVKINGEIHRDLMNKYGINSFPTDLVVAPDMKPLAQTSGLQPKEQYLATLDQFAPKAAPRVEPPVDPRRERQVARPQAQPPMEQAQPAVTRKTDLAARSSSKPGGLPPDVGMEGFCPVTLWKTRTWKPGRQEFACEYEGQTYFLSGPDQRDIFKQNPERYAPRLLGCDPVLLTDDNDAVPGTTKFGAYYEGALYLFKNVDTRKRFRDDPEQYIRIQQVKLDPKKIQR